MNKSTIVSIAALLLAAGALGYTVLRPAPEAAAPPPARAQNSVHTQATSERPGLRTAPLRYARSEIGATPTAAGDEDARDPFLTSEAAASATEPPDRPMLGPAPGQTDEEWREQEFEREREAQAQAWEAYDAELDDPNISAPLREEILGNFDASAPIMAGMRSYETDCRGARCMVTVEWDSLVAAQQGIDAIIAHSYPDCSRTIFLTPEANADAEDPYEQLIAMNCTG